MSTDMNQQVSSFVAAQRMKKTKKQASGSSGALENPEDIDQQPSASADAVPAPEESIEQRVARLVAALQNSDDMQPAALYSALRDAQEALVEWQQEWLRLQRRASYGKDRPTLARYRGPAMLRPTDYWDRTREKREERQTRWGKFVEDRKKSESTEQASQKPEGTKNAEKAKTGLNYVPEGVVAAPAARSLGESKAERTTAAAPITIPKDLVIDMVDDLAATVATGRGQRIRKPRKVFGEAAAPNEGKRKRAAVEDDAPTNAAPPPNKKRATSRSVSVVPASSSALPLPPLQPPAANKRKRAAKDQEAAPPPKKRATARSVSVVPFSSSAAPPPQPPVAKHKRKQTAEDKEAGAAAPPPSKKRAISRAPLTAPPGTRARTTSRAASAAPHCAASTAPPPRKITHAISRAASAGPSTAYAAQPPRHTTRATSRAASAAPSGPPPPQIVAIGAPTPLAPRTRLFYLSGFPTPLFSPHVPPPMLAPPPGPIRTLLPSATITAPEPIKRGRARKDQGATTAILAPAPAKAPARTKAESSKGKPKERVERAKKTPPPAGRKGKGKGRWKARKVEDEVAAPKAEIKIELVEEEKGKRKKGALDPVQEEGDEEEAATIR